MKFEVPYGATPLDPNELEGLIPWLSTQAELNEFEALNIFDGLDWAERSHRMRSGLLETGALELLHKRMFDRTWRWAGKYRTTQKSIGVESYRISSELHGLRENTKLWIQQETYSPDEIGARFHHRLVWIHPFANGNGRHARLATDLLLRRQRWDSFTWGSRDLGPMSEVRQNYIQALRAADAHDFGPLLAFVRR